MADMARPAPPAPRLIAVNLAALMAGHVLQDGEIVLLILKPSLWFIVLGAMRFVAVVVILMMAAALPAYSQQSSSSAPPANTPPPAAASATATATATASAQTTASDSAPAKPSEETLKKAKSLGLHPEVHNGVTKYCWEDASIGTRFPSKKCASEDQLEEVIAQRQVIKDDMRRNMNSANSH